MTIDLGKTGDFSRYTLALVTSLQDPDPPGASTRNSRPSVLLQSRLPDAGGLLAGHLLPATPRNPPDIHYLARDYDGFRQAMLDRMAVLVPTWDETHAADMGVAMVETLAYAADRVSYLQDAVNTEAYIGTARSRISLRRHARLVDYQVSEGANARAWVCLSATTPWRCRPARCSIRLVPGLPARSGDPGTTRLAAGWAGVREVDASCSP